VPVATNRYVPVRARVTGTLSDADLERLAVAVRRAVARRIAFAERNGSRAAGPAALVHERWARESALPEEQAYSVPSYQRGGQRVAVAVQQREPAEETALRRIHALLSTGVFDWFITDAEAREVLQILRRLAPEPLLRAVMMMRLTGDWRRFGRELPESDWPALVDLQEKMDRNAGYVMQGDDIRLEIWAGSRVQRDVSLEYNVRQAGVDLMLLDRPVAIVGLLPQAAAARIADAYVDGLIYVDPFVRLLVTKRGYLYAPFHGPTSQSLWFEARSRIAATSPERPRRERRSTFYAYIVTVRPTDRLTENALHHYYRWVEENYARPEFLTREPSDVWAWALRQASQPPPQLPIQPFLDLAKSMQERARIVPAQEAARMQTALGRYLAWLDLHRNDPDLARRSPVNVWVDAYTRTLREDIEAESRRRARELREAREHPPVDWEAAGRKLDDAIRLMIARVWHMPDPRIAEDREAGVGYLIWGSQLEREVRNAIASAFLHDVIARMDRPGFTSLTAEADFAAWLRERPQYLEALWIAQSHPDVERYNIPPEDIPAWQTAIEVGIAFIPVVGQVVAAGEATFGYDVFGHRLSTTSRAILAAGVLLPAAARTVQIGRAAVATTRIAEAYRLTAPEAEAFFRATAGIRPGSSGARLLGRAVEDVRAGREITDPARLRQIKDLLTDMGMTERSTIDALRPRLQRELAAAESGGATGGAGVVRPPAGGGPPLGGAGGAGAAGGGGPAVEVVEIGAGDLGASLRIARQGARVTAVDINRPASAAVRELEQLGGRFVQGDITRLPAASADQVFQYFPWRITGTGSFAYPGGTWQVVDEAIRVARPGGVVTFVTEDLATAEYLVSQSGRFASVRRAAFVQSTAAQAAPGATGAGVPGFGPSLRVWHVNFYLGP
jgi:SAM-dependent methyltransferase